MKPIRIENRKARWLWLEAQGLATPPTGAPDVLKIIHKLGFVQLDTIQVVARAHHHILWSRCQTYRAPMLDRLLRQERAVFEHFTHDASVIPMAFLPMWQRRLRRMPDYLRRTGWFRTPPDADICAQVLDRIRDEGALSTHAFDTKIEGPKQMWARPPHKQALDYLWFTGQLTTCHRVNFAKFYDLPERVFPADLRSRELSDSAQVDWLNRAALDRLGFGTAGDIQRFWEAVDNAEVRDWIATQAADLRPVEVECTTGKVISAYAPADIEDRLAVLRKPTARLRILNPFDPVVRDRTRLERLFGFEYRNEMFVPAAKRVWGYYVFPILEGDRFVGRIEAKADRTQQLLNVLQFWPEPGVKWPDSRQRRLAAELDRLARLVGAKRVEWRF